jgi:hypothetical protein
VARPDLWWVWRSMKQRCHNPRNNGYPGYGGRGIRVCDRWRHSFSKFADDVGPRPSKDHQLERINNDGDYAPGNCVWATRTRQSRNRRTTKFLTWNGVTKSVPDWAEEIGIRQDTLYQRLASGWSTERALQTPLMVQPKRKRAA